MKRLALLIAPILLLASCSSNDSSGGPSAADFQKCNYVNVSGGGSYNKMEPVYYTIAKYKSDVPNINGAYGDNRDEVYVVLVSSKLDAAARQTGKIPTSTSSSEYANLTKMTDMATYVSYTEVYYSVSTRTVKKISSTFEYKSGSRNYADELQGKYLHQGYDMTQEDVKYTYASYYPDYTFNQFAETVYVDVGSGTSVTYQLYTAPAN